MFLLLNKQIKSKCPEMEESHHSGFCIFQLCNSWTGQVFSSHPWNKSQSNESHFLDKTIRGLFTVLHSSFCNVKHIWKIRITMIQLYQMQDFICQFLSAWLQSTELLSIQTRHVKGVKHKPYFHKTTGLKEF